MKYAYFDPNTCAVLQLLDTDAFAYPSLPSTNLLLDVTDAQYSAVSTGEWYVVDGTLTQSAPDLSLEVERQAQVVILNAAYQIAIYLPVSYTSKGGVSKQYQASPQSIANLTQMLMAFQGTGVVPDGFYWVASDNTQVPFTYADLQGLAAAMGTQGVAAFQKLQTLKAEVHAAQSATAVQAIAWA